MAKEDLSALERMEYPGRVIIIGQLENGKDVVAYGLSGRSPSSQARVLNATTDNGLLRISTNPTDPAVLETGNKALLLYDVLISDGERTSVSNGAQTNLIWDIANAYRKIDEYKDTETPPTDVLNSYVSSGRGIMVLKPSTTKSTDESNNDPLKKIREHATTIDLTIYEPDKPIFTPRINGQIDHIISQAGFMIIRRDSDPTEDQPIIETHGFEVEQGRGYMIATYDGPNPAHPGVVPSFRGVGRPITFGDLGRTKDIADAVYEAMGEFAVSAACVTSGGNTPRYHIRNLHD
ncbi:MAG: IMP cyclohydrolase [Candidatus Woesearchaeota archaeon]